MKNFHFRKISSAGLALILAFSGYTAVKSVLQVNPEKMTQWTGGSGESAIGILEERVKMANSGIKLSSEPGGRTFPKRLASVDPEANISNTVDDGTRIVANIINWFMGDFLGVGSFRPIAGAYPEYIFSANPQSDLSGSGGVVIANGKVYKNKYGKAMGQVYSVVYNVYDIETGKLEESLELPGQWYSVWEHGAYNPVNGKIYVMGYDGMARQYISELNTETGQYTQLVQCNAAVTALDFNANGDLYAITDNGELVKLDLNTGSSTSMFRIVEPGVSLHYWHSMAFDRRTGELYWMRTDDNFNATLNVIDLTKQTVDLVSEMPAHFGTNYAYVVSPVAPEKAPDTVTAISVTFQDGDAIHGDIKVMAPEQCFDFSPLTGAITVTVYVDGAECGTKSATPGEEITFSGCEFIGAGLHKVSAVVANTEGAGPEGSVTIFCGADEPEMPTDVLLEISENGFANLKWTAPTSGIHNTEIDPSTLSYIVTRYPEGKIVAENLKEESFSDQLGSTLARYSYGVKAVCSGFTGEEAMSNSIVWGEGMELPIDAALGDDSFFTLCNIYDLDGDGNSFYQTWGSASAYSAYADSPYASNDWLITPPIKMKKGNYRYELTYMAAGDPVNATLTIGREGTPSAQTEVIYEIKNLLYQHGVQTTSLYISVPEDGEYYFGINFTSITPVAGDLTMPYGSFQRLRLFEGPKDEAPNQVENLSGQPAPEGELKTILTFTAPVTNYNGNPLSSLDRIEICDSEDNLIDQITNVKPGQECSWIHQEAVQGDNIYRLYAYNGEGRGKVNQITVYAGEDVPGLITSLNYSIRDNRVLTFEWGAPTSVGLNGGYCDPKEFTYDFCRSQYSTQMPTAVVGGTGLSERRFEYTECGPDSYYGTIQHQYLYGIQAVNRLGAGALGYVGIMCGDPFHAPFSESFAGGANSHVGWSSQVLDGEQAWSVSTGDSSVGIAPYDKDGGMLLFNHANDVQSGMAVITPFLALEKLANPVLEFALWHNPTAAREAYLSIQASRDNGQYTPITAIAASGEEGWQIHKISLKNYNGSDRVFIAFLGVNDKASDYFALDAIRVYDDVDYDLGISSFSAPASIELNEEALVNVEVKNAGLKDAGAFTVEIYANGEKIAEAQGNNLSASTTRVIPVKVRATASMARRNVILTAQVELPEDQNNSNDLSDEIEVKVGGSGLPAPSSLEANLIENGNVQLKWNAPVLDSNNEVSEGFEEYEAFAITSQGDWTFIDNDHLAPCGIGGISYPNMAEGRAFMVWNVSKLSFSDKQSWSPYSGQQCLIAFASDAYTVDGTFDGTYKSDEWLVSPHIVGGTTLKFMAGAPAGGSVERFEVLVSYGSRTPDDFTSLSGEIIVKESGWKEYTFTLPADAEYFAIRYISDGREAFALMLDDIEFTAGYSEVDFIGYNVYGDDAPLNEEPLNSTEWITPDTRKYYGVSAVYAEGESEMAEAPSPTGTYEVIGTGISVRGEKGCVVIEAEEGLSVSLYSASGQCIFLGETTGENHVSVVPGVYLVTVDSKTFKVIIR